MAEPDSTNSASAAGEEASATTEKSELLGNKVFVPKLSELRELIRDRLLVTVKATATPRTIRLSKNVFSYTILLFEYNAHKMCNIHKNYIHDITVKIKFCQLPN